MNVRMDSLVVKDPIKLAMQRSDNPVANTAKAGAAQDTVAQKTEEIQGQGDKSVKRALMLAANPADATAFESNVFASARMKLQSQGSSGNKRHSGNDNLAKGNKDEVSELLRGGNSALPTKVALYKSPVENTRLSDDRFLPKSVVAQKHSAALQFKTASRDEEPLKIKSERSILDKLGDEIGDAWDALLGKTTKKAEVGKKAHYIA